MTNNTHLLNDLVQVTRDSKSFYEDAAKETTDARLRDVFNRMAAAKAGLISALSGKVVALGETPAESGTVAGSLRKAYADVRAVFSKDDNKIYVGQLEETEDRILEHFEEALAKTDSVEVRGVLADHLPKVRACHDEMRDLKKAMGA
jgi:uncharacterized protein (TIGR02284 family)